MNLFDYLLNTTHDDKLAICSREEKVTYGELRAMAESMASALQSFNIQKGDRVAIIAENSAFWVASYLGIIKIGAIAVPIPLRISPEVFLKIIEIMDISAFCIDVSRFNMYNARLPRGSKLVLPDLVYTAPVFNEFRITAPVLDSIVPTANAIGSEDIAVLMFTSGSDGQPNAVKVTHHNIITNTESIVSYLELTAKDVIMVVLPFDYCFGTSLLHTHLRVGGTLVINNTFAFIETVLEDMTQFQCTGFAGVPTAYQHLLRGSNLTRYKLPHLRYVQQAGGRLSDVFIKQFIEAVPHARFFVMYGQTEATARLSYLPPEKLNDKLGSIGRGIPGVRLQVLDETGQPVEAGMIGEIVAEGYNIASGYYLPDPAKNSFRDGKLYTGDLARVDEEGYIYIVGRSSEFLKLHGHRISSAEIEDVLFELPDVVEAAVVAIQHPDLGEVATAYIMVRRDAEITSEQVLKHCKMRLPAFSVPREVQFLDELPKNEAGKILKRQLFARS